MKIIISQQGEKLLAEFKHSEAVDNYYLDKADEFLEALDKFSRKHKIKSVFIKNTRLEFRGTGMLSECVVKAIIKGLNFNKS